MNNATDHNYKGPTNGGQWIEEKYELVVNSIVNGIRNESQDWTTAQVNECHWPKM